MRLSLRTRSPGPVGLVRCGGAEVLAPDDPENCENAHPDGLAAFDAARNCFTTSCNADCVGADFSCVGSVQWRFSMTDIKLHVQVVDALNLAVPLDGVTVRACTPDVSCDTPLATSRPTAADGRTTLIVPGFPALEYFELEKDGFVVLWYWLPPVHGTSAIKLPMGDAALRAELLSAVGGDPAAGAIGVLASSCRRLVVDTPNGAAGLEVGTERGDPVAYFNGLVPDVTVSATGAIGLAFVHSVAPGTVTVFTEYQGQRVGSWPVYVRPGMDTFIALPPTPRR